MKYLKISENKMLEKSTLKEFKMLCEEIKKDSKKSKKQRRPYLEVCYFYSPLFLGFSKDCTLKSAVLIFENNQINKKMKKVLVEIMFLIILISAYVWRKRYKSLQTELLKIFKENDRKTYLRFNLNICLSNKFIGLFNKNGEKT